MRKLFFFFIFLFTITFLNAQDNNLTLVVKSFKNYPPIQTHSLNSFIEVYKDTAYIGKTNIVYEDDQPHFNEVFQIKDYNQEPIVIAAYVHRDSYFDKYLIGKAVIDKPENGTYDIMSFRTSIIQNDRGYRVEGNIEVEFQ